MLTRISTFIILFGAIVLAVGFSQDLSILLAVGIGMMFLGIIGFAIGVRRRQQTGNRLLYGFLLVIIIIVIVLGFFNVV